ncbi:MAG: hypothetical protein IT169_13060 [Bryobacterales bacterium]|nr:hypothetical protein [Bryobacterales bacterium]
MLRTNYVLIDYENVQPADLETLHVPQVQVLLFVGANQTKIGVDLVIALQSMNGSGRIVRCSANGPNALDFHIAYYCGEIVAQDKNAFLHIVSRDTGFDPLITHMKGRKIQAQRVTELCQISFLKIARERSVSDRATAIVEHFRKGTTRPRSLKTLSSTILTVFRKALSEQEVEAVVAELQKRKAVTVENGKLVYAIEAA